MSVPAPAEKHRVLVIGGGFAGLGVAKGLKHPRAEVTLVDRRNFHLFQPLLYQVATGSLSPANIAAPLRMVFRGRPDVRIVLGDVREIDVAGRRVKLEEADWLEFDTLVLATGSTHDYFGNGHWEDDAPGLKTVEDATEIRRRVLLAFEEAARTADERERAMRLTFVIVGGGPTGVEMAGAIAEIAKSVLGNEFRHLGLAADAARVLLVQGSDRLLNGYPESLSARTKRDLEDLGVEVRLGRRVTEVWPESVDVTDPETGAVEVIEADTVVWAAGVRASPLGRHVAEGCGVELDRSGRVPVTERLHVAGHPEVFALGDLAAAVDANGTELPGLGAVAKQQGEYVAKALKKRLDGKEPPPFRYLDMGTMATIGRRKAVADIRGWKFSGTFAWLMWLFVHLMLLVQFQNRLLVFLQWAWSYFTMGRTARIITVTPDSEPSEIDNPRPEPVAAG